jgi:hypothetical protein
MKSKNGIKTAIDHSSQFHQHFMLKFFYSDVLCETFSSYILAFVTKEKLREALSYKKFSSKMLMKLTPGGVIFSSLSGRRV